METQTLLFFRRLLLVFYNHAGSLLCGILTLVYYCEQLFCETEVSTLTLRRHDCASNVLSSLLEPFYLCNNSTPFTLVNAFQFNLQVEQNLGR